MTYHALELGLWFGAGAATAWRFTALHYRSRLSAATASEALYKAWWERDSGRAIIAEAKLDLIHQQHVDAGRKAHEPFKALRRETTEKLMQCVASRDANEVLPVAANPASGVPADLSAGRKAGGRGREVPHHSGQDTGVEPLCHATQRASTGNEPGQSCSRNRAGYSASAEFSPEAKGAI